MIFLRKLIHIKRDVHDDNHELNAKIVAMSFYSSL